MKPGTTGLTAKGLVISNCHDAPASWETYTDILGRERRRITCDACGKPCKTWIKPVPPTHKISFGFKGGVR